MKTTIAYIENGKEVRRITYKTKEEAKKAVKKFKSKFNLTQSFTNYTLTIE